MMVPAALLITSCLPPEAAPPDWSKSCLLVHVPFNGYVNVNVPWHLQTWPYRRAILSAWSELSAARAYPTLHISTLLLNGLVLSTGKLLHCCHGGGADRQLRPQDDIDSLRSHAVSAHSLSVLLLVCLSSVPVKKDGKAKTYSLVVDLDIVLVDITISIEITDVLGILAFLTKHREGGGEHGCVLISISGISIGGVDSGSLVD